MVDAQDKLSLAVAKDKLVCFDSLRGIAAFGIVGCHLLLSPRTQSGTLVTGLCDMNVGVFAALSGYLMAFGRWDGWVAYVRKRAWRILPVYAVWTVVYLIFSAAFQIVDGGAVNARYCDVGWWVDVVFWGAAATHLWFLTSLFYAQVAMAGLFRKIPSVFWIGCSFVLISTSIWSKSWYVTYPVRLLAFLMLGRGLASIDGEWLRRRRWLMLVLGLACVGLHFVHSPWPTGFVKDWIAVAPILLVFVAWSDRLTGRLASVSAFLGATSMGVYLIHPIFTKGVGLGVRRISEMPYGVVPVMADWVVSWLCALAVTLVFLRTTKMARFVK